MFATDIYGMPTTIRHNKILSKLISQTTNYDDDNLDVFFQDVALVHYGKLKSSFIELVNIYELEDEEIINDLDYVQPDFMLFDNNKFLLNKRETKIAGFPDLIIEIWSKGNTAFERKQKKLLYSSGKNTEHWYISQDSNIVECYLDEKRIKDKDLTQILITTKGLQFDLRGIALHEV